MHKYAVIQTIFLKADDLFVNLYISALNSVWKARNECCQR